MESEDEALHRVVVGFEGSKVGTMKIAVGTKGRYNRRGSWNQDQGPILRPEDA